MTVHKREGEVPRRAGSRPQQRAPAAAGPSSQMAAPSAGPGAGRPDASPVPLLMTLEEAAEALSVPPSWLRTRVAEHKVACTRLGRHIRFTRQQLQDVVDMSVQPVVPVPLTGLTRRSRRTA